MHCQHMDLKRSKRSLFFLSTSKLVNYRSVSLLVLTTSRNIGAKKRAPSSKISQSQTCISKENCRRSFGGLDQALKYFPFLQTLFTSHLCYITLNKNMPSPHYLAENAQHELLTQDQNSSSLRSDKPASLVPKSKSFWRPRPECW